MLGRSLCDCNYVEYLLSALHFIPENLNGHSENLHGQRVGEASWNARVIGSRSSFKSLNSNHVSAPSDLH